MGTLTGNVPCLEEHCPHKLPTSCRLTATAACCACQDKRPHSSSYPTYVDGIGMVMRGTRWQRYCYFCMQFWSNRLAATDPPMPPQESRVPEVPDQTSFLEKWFDYHRGYKYVRSETEGDQQAIVVAPEKAWRDCDPGTLPVLDEAERLATIRTAQRQVEQRQHVSLESTLDELLEEANGEAHQPTDQASTHQPATNERLANMAISSLSVRERNRQRAEEDLRATLRDLQSRVDNASTRLSEAEMRRDQLAREMQEAENACRDFQNQRNVALREFRRASRLQRSLRSNEENNARTAERLARVFGSREEIEQQGSEYVSPLTSMFARAYERFRIAEEVRREERASREMSQAHQILMNTFYRDWQLPQLSDIQGQASNDRMGEEQPQRTLDDENDNRPPPQTDDQMTIKLTCRVCLQQRATIAVLPCGHLIFCLWCADILVPTKDTDSTQPVRRTQCPCCRKTVKRRVDIYTV